MPGRIGLTDGSEVDVVTLAVNGAVVAGSGIPAVGDVAAAATDSGNPVKIGGLASNSVPTAVSNGQRVNAWWGLTGQLIVGQSSTPVTDAAAAGSLYIQSGSAAALGVSTSLYNSNAGWDRQRNNTDLTLLASAARTTATASADQTNFNGRGVRVVLNVTVASGTGGLQVQIRGKDSISGNYYQINTTPTAVTATGTFVYDIYPAAIAAANGITQATDSFVPRTWGINVAVGDSSSYTYSVSGVTLL
jgi:hypothetical protein